MERITGKKIKVSAHSITIKGESGKTAGVIRNTCKFKELQAGKQMEFFKAVRLGGVWGDSDLMENVVFKDGKMYFLHDLRPVEFYEKMFASNCPQKSCGTNCSKFCNSIYHIAKYVKHITLSWALLMFGMISVFIQKIATTQHKNRKSY